MFTGLIEMLAPVAEVIEEPPGRRLVIGSRYISDTAAIGDSVAVNGCCLTVVERIADRLHFQAGPETLSRTTLGRLAAGGEVNLERSLQLGDRLGGHLVTGHVDGIGHLASRQDDGDWSTFWFTAPFGLMPQMASKGSIAVDGVSLTLVEVTDDKFSVQLIPHTLAVTTLGRLTPGQPVNLETDLLAKYVARQLAWRQVGNDASDPRPAV